MPSSLDELLKVAKMSGFCSKAEGYIRQVIEGN